MTRTLITGLFCLLLFAAALGQQPTEWRAADGATVLVGVTKDGGFPLRFAWPDGRKTEGQATWETADVARSFRFSRDDTGEEYFGRYLDDKTIQVQGPDSTERWTFVK